MAHDTIQAVRFHDYGGPEVLTLDRVPLPQPQVNEVLVRVIATGVNPWDWQLRAGYYKEFIPVNFPATMGVEAAGLIEEVGAEVTGWQRGQAVFGPFSNNAHAEYAVVLAEEIVPKPAHITMEEAAAVTQGALTAWQVIEDAKVQKGQRVLVQGGAGGVGSYAVQLARWKGAQVIATASAANADFVRSLGADQVIDYNAQVFEQVVSDVDVVIDTIGGDITTRSFQVVRPGGVVASVAGRLAPNAGEAHNIRVVSSGRGPATRMKEIAELLDTKQIKAVVGSIYPLSEVRDAHALSQTGHGRGRILLLAA